MLQISSLPASRGTLTAPGTDKGKRTDSDFRLSAAYDFASKASYTFRQAMPVRPAVLHRDILAVDEAVCFKPPETLPPGAAQTGLRLSELIGLDRDAIHLGRASIAP
jgi:hypothetical protein